MPSLFPDIEIPESLIHKMDIRGPRYTSYPTADRFGSGFATIDYQRHLDCRAHSPVRAPLSVYVHVPFCASLCYYCACNRIITKDHRRSTKYLRYLGKELSMLTARIGGRQDTVQVHLGGGTPTFLNEGELGSLMQMLREHFEFSPDAEIGIEIDPRTVDAQRLGVLAEMGFNRISLGVQDFDAVVQKAVHRIQPFEMVEQTTQASRNAGFGSINFDLIYGLPKQTVVSFGSTLDSVIRLMPDRIALYNYAHLPTRFLAQRRIAEADLPSADVRLQIFLLAMRRLLDAGFIYIGLDHFARPDDELARSLINRNLHRNFQGYTTRAGCDLLGIGVSSISQIEGCYSQSVRSLEEYYDRLDANELPVDRGIALSQDDLVRRRVIMDLMCNTPVDFDAIDKEFGIEFGVYFADELESMRPFAEEGLIAVDRGRIATLPKGRLFVRAVAMVFDSYLKLPEAGGFSRVI